MFKKLDLADKRKAVKAANAVKTAYRRILEGADYINLAAEYIQDTGAYIIAAGLLNTQNIKYLYLGIIYL